MHSVYVGDVELPSPLLVEVQFVDCVISARFSLGRKSPKSLKATAAAPITPTCPPVKQRQMNWVSG